MLTGFASMRHPPVNGSGYPLSKLAKEGTDLLGQQLGFFQGGKMAASGHLFPSQNVVRSLAPLSGRAGDFLGKQGHARWGRDLVVLGISGFHVAVAVAPGAVFLHNPGSQAGRGVVEPVGQGLGLGALYMGVAALRLLPPRSLLDERLLGRGEGCGIKSQIGCRARDRGEVNAIQAVGMSVSQPRGYPGTNVAALRRKA